MRKISDDPIAVATTYVGSTISVAPGSGFSKCPPCTPKQVYGEAEATRFKISIIQTGTRHSCHVSAVHGSLPTPRDCC